MKREKALWTGGSSGVRLWCKSGQTGRLALRSQKNHITISGSCETLCEMELCEQFKQSAQALELLHERKMWNEQKPCCLSAASSRFLRMLFHILSEC